jgi:hypothetical protein
MLEIISGMVFVFLFFMVLWYSYEKFLTKFLVKMDQRIRQWIRLPEGEEGSNDD